MAQPLGYLLTWTCYGSWLHGDPRGSVDFRHNVYGEPFADAHQWRQTAARARLKHAPVVLDPECRAVTRRAIEAHCAYRAWELFAVNVRTNHVHVVVSCGAVAADTAIAQFKAYATRALRAAGHFAREVVIWTSNGSGRMLWTQDHLRRAVAYVDDHQGPDI